MKVYIEYMMKEIDKLVDCMLKISEEVMILKDEIKRLKNQSSFDDCK